MQYDKYVVGYERLSKDDPDSTESSSILYQKMIIADYVKNIRSFRIMSIQSGGMMVTPEQIWNDRVFRKFFA